MESFWISTCEEGYQRAWFQGCIFCNRDSSSICRRERQPPPTRTRTWSLVPRISDIFLLLMTQKPACSLLTSGMISYLSSAIFMNLATAMSISSCHLGTYIWGVAICFCVRGSLCQGWVQKFAALQFCDSIDFTSLSSHSFRRARRALFALCYSTISRSRSTILWRCCWFSCMRVFSESAGNSFLAVLADLVVTLRGEEFLGNGDLSASYASSLSSCIFQFSIWSSSQIFFSLSWKISCSRSCRIPFISPLTCSISAFYCLKAVICLSMPVFFSFPSPYMPSSSLFSFFNFFTSSLSYWINFRVLASVLLGSWKVVILVHFSSFLAKRSSSSTFSYILASNLAPIWSLLPSLVVSTKWTSLFQ